LVEDNFEKLSNNLLKSNIESDFKQEYKIQIILIFLTKIVFLDTLYVIGSELSSYTELIFWFSGLKALIYTVQ